MRLWSRILAGLLVDVFLPFFTANGKFDVIFYHDRKQNVPYLLSGAIHSPAGCHLNSRI